MRGPVYCTLEGGSCAVFMALVGTTTGAAQPRTHCGPCECAPCTPSPCRTSPALILVDTVVIANAPKRLLVRRGGRAPCNQVGAPAQAVAPPLHAIPLSPPPRLRARPGPARWRASATRWPPGSRRGHRPTPTPRMCWCVRRRGLAGGHAHLGVLHTRSWADTAARCSPPCHPNHVAPRAAPPP